MNDTPPPAPASRRIRRVQRLALALLLMSGVINYVDRSTLAIGLPLIRQDLHLSLAQSGCLLSAFLWAYAFFQLPAGALVDRLGARLMLAMGLGLWSMAQLLAGLVANFWQFVIVRVLLGAGESPLFPTCARTVADWFHRRERGFATGIWNCSGTLGSAISAPLLTFLMLSLSWRWMFVIMGIAGLIVAIGAYCLHRNPSQVPLTGEELDHLADGQEKQAPVTWSDWKGLFRYRTTWGMILGFFGVVYVTWIYNAWLPQYLEIEHHVSIARTGWIASIPFVFGAAGSVLGGRICDIFLRHGHSPMASRKIPMVISLLASALFTLLAGGAGTTALAVFYISTSMFLLYIASTAAWAMVSVATTQCTASLGSIQNCGGYLGGALAPIVTGLIAQKTGSFRSTLVVGAAVSTAAALLHLILVRGPIPSTSENKVERAVPSAL